MPGYDAAPVLPIPLPPIRPIIMDGNALNHSFRDSPKRPWTIADALILLTAVATVACVVREVYIWGFHLRGIPGPFWNSFSCNWTLFRKGYNGTLYQWEKKLNDENGRLVRIGPNHILTDDPDILKRIGSPRSAYTKSDWFAITTRFLRGVDSTLSTGRQGQKDVHTARRTLLATTYYGKENSSPSVEEALDTQIAGLIHLIDTRYAYTDSESFKPCPFGVIGQYFTLDFITVILWSEPFGFLKQERDIGNFFQTLEAFLPVRAALGSLSFLPLINPLIEIFIAPSPQDKFGLGRLEGIAQEKIDERLRQIKSGNKDVPNDILAAFIAKGLKGKDLSSEVFMTLVAASENPSTMLRMAIALLMVNPTAYARLNAEISSVPFSTPITDAEARALPYLQAVLRETIRLYPVPAEMYKQVGPAGDTVAGHYLPGGTWIGHNYRAMMRRRDIWGGDADIFRPERWIEAAEKEPQRFRMLCGVVDHAFGSGRFLCMGKAVGIMVLGKTVVELLRRFDFAAVDPERVVKVDVYNLYLVRDQQVVVTRKGERVGQEKEEIETEDGMEEKAEMEGEMK
ncbi:cytochrome P450 [Cercophora newfieldiana]|uniref:Cytochrome P450 n=1 Tax=Cercophora newfieldiana TaxID=92897 RepID=A0AA40CNA2_9PEZI|nr:cytochrome P450 [Cercophora newfieldiana]